MLRSLYINNIALIKTQSFDFDAGFNVLSGETGAGKSIIVDSLMLILGGKADKLLIRFGQSFCRVEAEFDTTPSVARALSELDIDAEDSTIITRKISAEGKSENRINGRSVTLSAVKQIGNLLVDICGQNEYQFLSQISNHIALLDYYVRHSTCDLLADYAKKYGELKTLNSKLKEIGELKQRDENIDFLKKQLNAILKADIKEGEEEELLALRKKYQYSERILNALSKADGILSGSTLSALESAERELSSVSAYDPNYEALANRLNSIIIELDDISETVHDNLSALDFDNDDIDELESRLQKIKELTKKYGSVEAINKKADELAEKINFLENADELYSDLVKTKKSLLSDIYKIATRISEERRKGAAIFEKSVEKELSELGMENSQFKVDFTPIPELNDCEKYLTRNGFDSIEFYLSPNVGQPLKPLTKIISGGEQSRLMLALKVIAGENDGIPTLVFDEIDTGISGKIGLEVAKKIARLSKTHQVLCVTHLPHIAAMADANYFIYKRVENGETVTNVNLLSESDQYDEIARLSGNKDISDQALESAKQMKEWSESYKRSL